MDSLFTSDVFVYTCKELSWDLNPPTELYILKVIGIKNNYVTVQTLNNKQFRRKVKQRPSGKLYIEHDARKSGGRNKYDKMTSLELEEFLNSRPQIGN